jgi:murein DD-endopeptidase MepM/ murein hydrolase activator NlpD
MVRKLLLLMLVCVSSWAQDFKLPVEISYSQQVEYAQATDFYLASVEISMTNHYSPVPVFVESIEVFDNRNEQLIAEVGNDNVELSTQKKRDKAYRLPLKQSEEFFIDIKAKNAPKHVYYKIDFLVGEREAGKRMSFVSDAVSLHRHSMAISVPFSQLRWAAINGPGILSEHRTQPVYLNGKRYLSQRYAYDFVGIGEDGKVFKNRGEKVDDWYGYASPVMAGASGEVANVFSAFSDNITPGEVSLENRRNPCGNGVVIALADGKYLTYCHLQQGSVYLQVGNKVEPSTVIGQVGNSGNSDAPHLHMHLSDYHQPLKGNGLPIEFNPYLSYGSIADFDQLIENGVAAKPTPITDKGLILGNSLIGAVKK